VTDPDPTGWFERLYAAAEQGEASIPWDRGGPNPVLVRWAEERALEGGGRRALVVGSGLGGDAELIAALGFDTVAFDVSPTAVKLARERFPGSPVRYVVADLLDAPPEWRREFDLVVESLTAQSLPEPPRGDAIAAIGSLLAPGGTLIVISAIAGDHDFGDGPPWPLTRAEVGAFATGGVRAVAIETVDAGMPGERRWRAEFTRDRVAPA
jgi:SAM-dependent methyltransferase